MIRLGLAAFAVQQPHLMQRRVQEAVSLVQLLRLQNHPIQHLRHHVVGHVRPGRIVVLWWRKNSGGS